MSMINSNLLLAADAAGAGGYSISRSLRFNAADSSFLSHTPASAGNRKTWTWAGWVKRSGLGTDQALLDCRPVSSDSQFSIFYLKSTNTLEFSGPVTTWFTTSAVFRDCSAWMHIVLALDTTQATAANRIKLYVNGSQITAFSTSANPSQNADLGINQAALHGIGAATTPSAYLNGYLADIHFIDGQALDPTSFGEFSATTGVWVPKAYTGSYGSQGWHLDFADNSAATAAALGKDTSGNSPANNWTPNNISTYIGYSGTISATSTSSQPTYQSTGTYSSYLYTNSFPAATFAGSTDARPYVSNYTYNGGTYYCTWFPPGLTFNKSLRIFCINAWNAAAGGTTYRMYTEVNGKKPTVGSGWSWVDYSSLMTPGEAITSITAFTVKNSSDSWSPDLYWPAAIEIDGYILVSGAGLRNITTTTPSGFVSELRLGDSVLASGASSGSGIVYSKDAGSNSFVLASPSGSWVAGATLSNNSQSTKENDSLLDVPTNGSEVDSGLGNQVRGNYCTWNPIAGSTGVVSNGNLDTSNASVYRIYGTIGVSSGKYYWEHTVASIGSGAVIGISNNPSQAASDANRRGYYSVDGNVYTDSSNSAYGATYTTGDVIGIAYDGDNGKLYFSKNGTWQNSGNPVTGANPAVSGLTGTFWPFATIVSCTLNSNWGQRSWAYQAPAGFKALCTANLPAPVVTKPSDLFDVKLWTGNGSSQTISGLGFSPDLVWVKQRSAARSHWLTDTVRGNTKLLSSDQTSAEITETDCITSFNSDGFSLDADAGFNASSGSYAAWAWDAGNTTVTNTQGSIASQVRANPSAGFSVVTYTGTGANATVGHGLGVAPSMLIVKNRSSSADNWQVYHQALGNANLRLRLNATDGADSVSTMWNGTAPSSTVFSVGTQSGSNGSSNLLVAYCWAPLDGYSSAFSFTGNGSSSDGPFVALSFRPKLLLIKRTDATGNWLLVDAARGAYNLNNTYLYANTSDAEAAQSGLGWDFLSNGFKIRNAYNDSNASSGTYVGFAWAESPFAANNRAR